MPNWVSNTVVVTHDQPPVLETLYNVFNSDAPFNTLNPEPDWSIIPDDKGVIPAKKVTKIKDMDGNTKELVILRWPDGSQDTRWRTWRNENWGCKWDIDVDYIDYSVGNNLLVMEFETPWSPPDAIYEKLCGMGYEFLRWAWQDEDPSFGGDLTVLSRR